MASRTASRTGRGRDHRAVLGAFLALGTAAGTWGSRIPDIRDDLDLSEGSLGTALLALSIGAVTGSWIGGLLVRRIGSRAVVRGAWVAVGLALVLPGQAGGWSALAASVLVLGLAIGVLDVSMNGAGVQLEAAAERPLLNGLHAGWSGGVLLGAAVGSVAVALDIATATHLAVVGVVIAVTGAVVGGGAPDGRLAPAAKVDGARATRAARRRLAALAGIAGCTFLAEGAVLDWFGVLVREDLEGGALLGALAVTGVSLGGLLGRLGGDRLAARWGGPTLVRAGVALAATAFAAALVTPVAATVPLLLVAVGAGLAPGVPLAFAAAGKGYGEAGIATVTTAGYGSYLAGPAMIGWLAEAAALRVALLVPFVLIVLVAALAWSTGGAAGDRQPHPEPV